MTEPNYNIEYECGAQAIIDWVAGGNFDGYIFKKSILFKKENNLAVIKTHIIDQGRYDGKMSDSEVMGKHEFTDKDTITLKYNDFSMRGKILGNEKNIIAFSVYHPLIKNDTSEVYQLANKK